MTPVIAHFGHWYVQLLYAGPVCVIVAALWFQAGREKRQATRSRPPAGRRARRRK